MSNIGSYEYVDHDHDARMASPLRSSALWRQRIQAMRQPPPDDNVPDPAQPPDPARRYFAIGAGPDGLGHKEPPPEPPPGPGPAIVSGYSLTTIVGSVLVLSVVAGLLAPKILGFKPNRRRRRR